MDPLHRADASEHTVQLILAHAPVAMLTVRPDGRIASANAEGHRLFGYPAGTLVGRPVEDLLPEPLRAGHVALREGYLQAPKPRPMLSGTVLKARHHDGSGIDVEVALTPLTLPDGPAVLATILDARQRLRAERLQQEAEVRQRRLLEGLPQLIWTCRPDGPCDYLSRQWVDYTGIPEAGQLGYGWVEAVHPDDRAHAQAAWQAAVAAGTPLEVDFRIRRHDGAYRWFHTLATPQRDPTGAITGWIGSNTDTQDLVELREQAEAADRAKGEFLATMSHEIRTPMNGVLGMLGMLSEMPLDPEARRLAATAQDCAGALLHVLNDILDLSRLESGRLDLEHTAFDLHAGIEEAVAAFAPTAAGKGLRLDWSVADGVPRWVLGDPARLRQVVFNLVGNALKFTEQGAVQVHLAPGEDGQGQVVLRVQDTGIGIPEDRRAGLFERFSQVDRSISRRYGGSGLGLAICKRLVGLMGGAIGVTSAPGRGSTFQVTLPLAATPAPPGTDPAPLTGRTVLLAGAPTPALAWLARCLEQAGGRIITVADGPAVLAARYTSGPGGAAPDTMLLDADLPGLDPTTLARVIRADPGLGSPRLILLGARPGMALPEGFQAALTRPLRRTELLALLAPAQAAPEPPAPPPLDRTGRVLVVDDTPVNQDYVAALLRRARLDFALAGNGQEALDRLAAEAFDLVLMDVEMPGLDGLAATRRIRDGSVPGIPPRIPVVGLTAHALPADRTRCLAAGMDDYAAKPLTPADLRQLLRRWLPPATPEAPLVDRALLSERLGGDAAVAEDLLRVFCATAGPTLIDLAAASLARDRQRLARTAHRLAGSAGSAHAFPLQRSAQALELAAPAAPWEDLDRDLARLKDLHGRTLATITPTADHGGPGPSGNGPAAGRRPPGTPG